MMENTVTSWLLKFRKSAIECLVFVVMFGKTDVDVDERKRVWEGSQIYSNLVSEIFEYPCPLHFDH